MGQWDIIGDGRDERELEVEIIKDTMVYSGEVLEFELGVSGTTPLKEGNLVVMQERSLEDVGDPLVLLSMSQWVIDVARNGGLTSKVR